MLSNSEAFEVISRGTFFYPAFKHYGITPRYVSCNLCANPNITSCIGYQNYDICLSCTDSLLNRIPQQQPQPSLYQNLNSNSQTQSQNQNQIITGFNNNKSSLDEYFMPLNSFSGKFKK